jgi:hypothetical protein
MTYDQGGSEIEEIPWGVSTAPYDPNWLDTHNGERASLHRRNGFDTTVVIKCWLSFPGAIQFEAFIVAIVAIVISIWHSGSGCHVKDRFGGLYLVGEFTIDSGNTITVLKLEARKMFESIRIFTTFAILASGRLVVVTHLDVVLLLGHCERKRG